MLHIILVEPQIPQNTGNIGRLCAVTKAALHLIHPLGFRITDKQLKRSGMDYWDSLELYHHETWEDFKKSDNRPERVWLFTTKGNKAHWDADFRDGDGLMFGNEGRGAAEYVHDWVGDERRLIIPQYSEHLRSLNLSTSVGIATYEALRQISCAKI